jgi:hypothetical protein
VTQLNRGLPRMLELVELAVQAVVDLRDKLVVDIARLRALHAVHLALARHAVLHHVHMRHLSKCAARALLNASLILLCSNHKSRWLSDCDCVGVTHASVELECAILRLVGGLWVSTLLSEGEGEWSQKED